MATTHEPTTAELKEAWKKCGLWRSGHTFAEDMQRPIIVWALRKTVLARNKKHATPAQGVLI